ncbi:MAG: hypothetical protein LBJ10_03165 [Clostridiales bacterium]|jgi:hypothetical protein|nr:hypothetical protein [Clostridiales bacterium]
MLGGLSRGEKRARLGRLGLPLASLLIAAAAYIASAILAQGNEKGYDMLLDSLSASAAHGSFVVSAKFETSMQSGETYSLSYARYVGRDRGVLGMWQSEPQEGGRIVWHAGKTAGGPGERAGAAAVELGEWEESGTAYAPRFDRDMFSIGFAVAMSLFDSVLGLHKTRVTYEPAPEYGGGRIALSLAGSQIPAFLSVSLPLFSGITAFRADSELAGGAGDASSAGGLVDAAGASGIGDAGDASGESGAGGANGANGAAAASGAAGNAGQEAPNAAVGGAAGAVSADGAGARGRSAIGFADLAGAGGASGAGGANGAATASGAAGAAGNAGQGTATAGAGGADTAVGGRRIRESSGLVANAFRVFLEAGGDSYSPPLAVTVDQLELSARRTAENLIGSIGVESVITVVDSYGESYEAVFFASLDFDYL